MGKTNTLSCGMNKPVALKPICLALLAGFLLLISCDRVDPLAGADVILDDLDDKTDYTGVSFHSF